MHYAAGLWYNAFPMRIILTFMTTRASLYSAFLGGIRRRLDDQYELQTIDYEISDRDLRKVLNFWHPIGCIVVGAEGVRNLTPRAFGTTPVVYIDRTPMTRGNYLDVVQDYEEHGRIAARELLQSDIEDYAFVGNKHPANWSNLRGRAFAAAIRLHRKSCHVFNKTISESDRPLLLEKWLVALPKPCAVFAANDRTAAEVLTTCVKNGIAIPDDISLLGIDNVEDICEHSVPTLSSIHFDSEQGGWMCADLLIERLSNPSLRRATRTYATLGVIQRASTRKSYGYDGTIERIVNLIRSMACSGLSVEDVASEMGCSIRMAEIRFQHATGTTIKSYITDIRLERAKILLRDKENSIRGIASRCGYNSDTALRIAFKNKFKTSPSAWRAAVPR